MNMLIRFAILTPCDIRKLSSKDLIVIKKYADGFIFVTK